MYVGIIIVLLSQFSSSCFFENTKLKFSDEELIKIISGLIRDLKTLTKLDFIVKKNREDTVL
jgi:hypothetical protein